jgi:hypothetical protein
MKWIGRTLAALIVVGLLIFVVHLVHVYLIPHWAAILFYVYLIFGLLLMASGQLFLSKSIAHSGGFRELFIQSFAKAGAAQSLLSTIRNLASGIIVFLSGILIWPIGFGAYLKPEIRKVMGSGRIYVNTVALQSIEHHGAFFCLLSIALVYLGGYAGLKGHGYGIKFAFIITISVVLRDMVYSLQVGGLPAKLRRVSTSPYLVFVAIMLMDFLSLAGGFALIKAGDAHSVTLQQVIVTSKELYQGKDLMEILYGRHLSLIELTIGSAGLVFYGALLGIVLHLKEFQRRDEDFLWLASQYNALGNFNKAIKYSNQIKARTPEAEAVQLISLLGVNQLDKARQKAAQLSTEGTPPTLTMLETAALSPVPLTVTISLFTLALSEKMGDVLLQDSVTILVETYPGITGKLAEIIAPHKTEYPLTYAELLLDAGQAKAALQMLESPMTGLAEMLRLVKQLRAFILENEEPPVFEQWAETNLPRVRTLIGALTAPWEKLIAVGQLTVVLFIAERLGKERVEEISYLLDELKSQVSIDPQLATGVKALEIRLKMLQK